MNGKSYSYMITIKDKIKNKLWHLKYKMSEFRYNLGQSVLMKLGVRPTYLAEVKYTPIDLIMHTWKEFAGGVVAFGDCDGFAKIYITTDGPNVGMPEGWFYAPPEHFLLIDDEGSIVDLWLESKLAREEPVESREERKKKTPEELKEELDNDHDDRIFWVVDCKATGVGLHSKHQVRHGFWTRIVSTSLELALNKTYELWKAEHNLSDKEKEKKSSRDNYSKVFLENLWRGENPIEDQMKFEIVKGDYIEKFRKELDPEDWYNLWRLLKERQEELTEFTEAVKSELEGIYPIFDQYLLDKDRRHKEDTDYKRDPISGLITFRHSEDWDDMMDRWDREDQLKDQMIESVKEKFKRP